MTKAIAEVAMREITGVIAELEDTAIYTWRRQAQKVAAIGWRDSETPPGALARFTIAGDAFYQFSERKYHLRRKGADRLPYVHSGAFRESIAQRKPVSKNTRGGYSGGEVVTTISIDGAALNLLTNKFGYTSFRRGTKPIVVTQPAYTRPGANGLVRVSGSTQHRTKKVLVFTPASQSYRDEFKIRDSDLADLRRRDEIAFRGIVRGAAFTKSGKLKTSVLAKFTTVEEAT